MTNHTDFDALTNIAERLLLSCGVPTHLIGFTYLAEAVACKLAYSPKSLKELYEFVAKRHGILHTSVSRDITYAIDHSTRLCSFLNFSDSQIFRGRVISDLAVHIKTMTPPPRA